MTEATTVFSQLNPGGHSGHENRYLYLLLHPLQNLCLLWRRPAVLIGTLLIYTHRETHMHAHLEQEEGQFYALTSLLAGASFSRRGATSVLLNRH